MTFRSCLKTAAAILVVFIGSKILFQQKATDSPQRQSGQPDQPAVTDKPESIPDSSTGNSKAPAASEDRSTEIRSETDQASNHSLDQEDLEAEEERKQSLLADQIVEEMMSARTAWQSYRENVFDELQIESELRIEIESARKSAQQTFNDIMERMRESRDDQKTEHIEAIHQTRNEYDRYIQSILGPQRYGVLVLAQRRFNDGLRDHAQHGAQISGDW